MSTRNCPPYSCGGSPGRSSGQSSSHAACCRHPVLARPSRCPLSLSCTVHRACPSGKGGKPAVSHPLCCGSRLCSTMLNGSGISTLHRWPSPWRIEGTRSRDASSEARRCCSMPTHILPLSGPRGCTPSAPASVSLQTLPWWLPHIFDLLACPPAVELSPDVFSAGWGVSIGRRCSPRGRLSQPRFSRMSPTRWCSMQCCSVLCRTPLRQRADSRTEARRKSRWSHACRSCSFRKTGLFPDCRPRSPSRASGSDSAEMRPFQAPCWCRCFLPFVQCFQDYVFGRNALSRGSVRKPAAPRPQPAPPDRHSQTPCLVQWRRRSPQLTAQCRIAARGAARGSPSATCRLFG